MSHHEYSVYIGGAKEQTIYKFCKQCGFIEPKYNKMLDLITKHQHLTIIKANNLLLPTIKYNVWSHKKQTGITRVI